MKNKHREIKSKLLDFDQHIFIGPPGIGKSTFVRKYGNQVVEPEEELDWNIVNKNYGIYPSEYAGKSIGGSVTAFEHNIHWPALWSDEIIPRIIDALSDGKHVVLSLITPSSIEMAKAFLLDFRESTVLILPDEDVHYKRFWIDNTRPKTWTNHLLTWNHTLSVRLLLLGLAQDLGIKILNDFPILSTYHMMMTSRNISQFSETKKNAMIFFTGMFNPIHRGQIQILEKAKQLLEYKGWNVVRCFVSLISCVDKSKFTEIESIIGAETRRTLMIRLAFLKSKWVFVDSPVDNLLEECLFNNARHPVQMIYPRYLRNQYFNSNPKATTFWLINLPDVLLYPPLYRKFTQYADQDPNNPLRLLAIVDSDTDRQWEEYKIDRCIPGLRKYISIMEIESIDPTRESAIRQSLTKGDRSALRRYLGIQSVEAYLMGLMYKLQMKENNIDGYL